MMGHAPPPVTRAHGAMNSRIPALSAVFAAVLSIASPGLTASLAQTKAVPDGASVIRDAFERYNSTWYRTLTFVQQTIQYSSGGVSDTAIWYEAYEAPLRLRIDVAPLASRTMFLFANDSQFVFRRDTLVSAKRMIHPLLLLGFDMYFLPPQESLEKLKELGFDVNVVHSDRWLERPVIVVGAPEGDTTSAQFWIDAERLVLVRVVMPIQGHRQEILFNRYQELADGWIAPEVVVAVDGRIVLKELYNEICIGTTFDPAFFDPASWRTAPHWHPERSRGRGAHQDSVRSDHR